MERETDSWRPVRPPLSPPLLLMQKDRIRKLLSVRSVQVSAFQALLERGRKREIFSVFAAKNNFNFVTSVFKIWKHGDVLSTHHISMVHRSILDISRCLNLSSLRSIVYLWSSSSSCGCSIQIILTEEWTVEVTCPMYPWLSGLLLSWFVYLPSVYNFSLYEITRIR